MLLKLVTEEKYNACMKSARWAAHNAQKPNNVEILFADTHKINVCTLPELYHAPCWMLFLDEDRPFPELVPRHRTQYEKWFFKTLTKNKQPNLYSYAHIHMHATICFCIWHAKSSLLICYINKII